MRDLRKRDHPDLRIIHHLLPAVTVPGHYGRASGDRSSNLQIVLFQHDHVRVAMEALIAKAERGDLYPRLSEIIGRLG
jgi:hypothetical protein